MKINNHQQEITNSFQKNMECFMTNSSDDDKLEDEQERDYSSETDYTNTAREDLEPSLVLEQVPKVIAQARSWMTDKEVGDTQSSGNDDSDDASPLPPKSSPSSSTADETLLLLTDEVSDSLAQVRDWATNVLSEHHGTATTTTKNKASAADEAHDWIEARILEKIRESSSSSSSSSGPSKEDPGQDSHSSVVEGLDWLTQAMGNDVNDESDDSNDSNNSSPTSLGKNKENPKQSGTLKVLDW